jgi:hypothetical protein
MKSKIKSNIIAEFIPIILIFTYLSYPNEMFSFLDSSLGRLIIVGIIIFYSAMDKMIGLLVCGLVILFYQMDGFTFYNFQLDLDMESFFSDFQDRESFAKYERMETLPRPKEVNLDKNATFEQAKAAFREKHCENGVLKYKTMPVNLQMVEHIFPEIEFHKILCNPCKTDCKYSIIESRIIHEETMRPVNTTL